MRIRGAIWATAGGLLLVASPALAHDAWLVPTASVGEIPPLFRVPDWRNVSVAAAAVLATLALVYLGRRRKAGPPIMLVSALAPWVPTMVGVALAAIMLRAALARTLFAPDLPVPDAAIGTWAVTAEIAAAILVGTGLFARVGAVVALGLFAFACVWGKGDSYHLGWGAALESIVIPGMALFTLVWGRGRLALGSVFGRIFYAMDSGHAKPVATTALRIMTGATFVALAAVKFLRPDLHFAVLDANPGTDPQLFLTHLLPALSRDWYLYLFATVEAALGILLAAGAFTRAVALVLSVALLVAPLMFGGAELMNHLPLLASCLALVALGRDKTD